MKQLVAPKEVYRIWFEFYKFALKSEDPTVVSKLKQTEEFYKDWGVNAEIHFDDWWVTHSYLFEVADSFVTLATHEAVDSGALLIRVPRDLSVKQAVTQVEALLVQSGFDSTSVKQSRYVPTEIKGLKRDALRVMIDLQKNVFVGESLKGKALRRRVHEYFSSERYKKKQNQIPFSFMVGNSWNPDEHNESADRNIRRYRQKIKKLIENVSEGVFPGKYD